MWTNSAFAISLAFVVVALFMIPSASAEPFPIIEHGPNYDQQYQGLDDERRPIYTWTSKPDRILDGGQYKNYILREDTTNVYFESAHGSLTFNKESCAVNTFDGGRISGSPNMVLSHTIKEAVNGTDTWYQIPENNLACQYSVVENDNLVKLTAWRGNFVTIYDIDYSYGFEWTYQYTNTNPSKTDHKYGFTFTCDGGQCDDIRINNTPMQSNQTTKDAVKGKKITLGDIEFDPKNEVHDYLWAIKKLPDKMVADFTHSKGRLPVGETLEVDPTFGYSSAQSQQYVQTNSVTQCLDGVGSSNGSYTVTSRVYIAATGAADNCVIQIGKFIISSIPDTASILSANLRLDQNGGVFTTNPRMIVARNMTLDPQGSATAAQKWIQGTQGNFNISPVTVALSTNDQVFAFNSNGTTYIQSQLDDNWVGWGLGFVSMRSDATAHGLDQLINWELQITYVSSPPNMPTNFAADPQATRVQFTWTPSNPASEIVTYYIGRSLDNSTWPSANKTSTGNVTSYLSTAYWRPGQLYYANITANNGVNSTYADYVSFTTDDYPDAPTIRLSPISGTQVNATRTAGASDGGDTVDDFGLRCEINATGGWQTVVSNSSLPSNNKHTISGLWSTGDLIKCQWRDGNDVGWSAWSANATYPARPDAITDLEVVAVFQTTAQISWSAPNIHGLDLIGYQVNYTSPWGTPNTVIIVTNTTDTEYSILGLTPNTQYSFRVSAVTLAGNNATGNIVNVSTITDFSVGDIDLDDANPFRMPIRFVETELNSTTTELEVIYDNEYEMDCEMYFQFAQETQNYPNLNGTEYDDDNDSVIFYFNNAGNEVIVINCNDTITNATGRYQMMQSDFPLLDLINGFRDGTYGTHGQFGVIDLITLLALIFGMIGFNRTNPSVGAIFMFFIMGGLAAFGIVQWYTAVSGMLALILFVVISATRKDD